MVTDINEGSVKITLNAAIQLQISGDTHGAETAYRTLIAADSKQALVYSNLGIICMERAELPTAIQLFEKAIELQPDFADAFNNLGSALNSNRRPNEATVCYRRAIDLKPNFAMAYFNLGVVEANLGQHDTAIECYKNSLKCDPNRSDSYHNLGSLFITLGRFDEAVTVFSRLVELFSEDPFGHYNLGYALQLQNLYQRSISYFQKQIVINADFSAVHFRLALSFDKVGSLEAAEKSYGEGLRIEPGNAEAWSNLGGVLKVQGKLDDAGEFYRKAWELDANLGIALINFWAIRQQCCDWRNIDERNNEVRQFIRNYDPESDKVPMVLFPLLAMFDDPELHRQAATQYGHYRLSELETGSVTGRETGNHSFENEAQGRIKIAYLSADFRSGVVYDLMAELFEKHDRKRFEVHAISYGQLSSDTLFNQRLTRSFDYFHDLQNWSDNEIANKISQLEINIAIDLMGYTEGNRSLILAKRPAAIQMSYLGYLGTMATDYIDYIIADSYVLPIEQQLHYSEKIIHLPGCYQVNCSYLESSSDSPTRVDCGLPEEGFVFCSFNNSYKINSQVFDLWMALLEKVEGSVLWLYGSNSWMTENLCREAAKRNVDESRIVFAEYLSSEQNLARLKYADLFLDTFPYNAGATCSLALWAGLPLITMPGKAYTSRMAASQLRAIGLKELIAKNEEEYFSLALELALSSKKLDALKSKLAINRDTSILFNTGYFVDQLEEVFTSLWQQHSGEYPATFAD